MYLISDDVNIHYIIFGFIPKFLKVAYFLQII
jgi:hypothetical protein